MPFTERTPSAQNNPESGQDSRYASLLRFIKWQGRILVLLAVVLGVVFFIKKTDVRLPPQEPVNDPPPLTEDKLQYILWAYQDAHNITENSAVSKPELTVMGQIYDFQDVRKKWPDVKLTINGASVDISAYGTCAVNLTLKPGPNVISSALLIDGRTLQSKQMVMDYTPPVETGP